MLESRALYFCNRMLARSIVLYQKYLSPLLGRPCRFYPSCSEYARQCFLYYPLAKAFLKSCYRILRCQPFAKFGEDDPLPLLKEIPCQAKRKQRKGGIENRG